MNEEALRIRIRQLERRFNLLLLIVVAAIGGGIAAEGKQPDVLRVRQLTVVDDRGVERVRLGAPLPEPLILGKRIHRGGAVSGVMIYDAEGNERGGYVTSDGYPNAFLTLDGLDSQHVLLICEPQGSPALLMWDDKKGAVRLQVDEGEGQLRLARAGKVLTQLPAEVK